MNNAEPINIMIPGSADDPRDLSDIDGVIIHRVPALQPDDVTIVDGIPVTSVARTLVDLADVTSIDELRDYFRGARDRGCDSRIPIGVVGPLGRARGNRAGDPSLPKSRPTG